MDVGDVDSKAVRLHIPIGSAVPSVDVISEQLLAGACFRNFI